MGTSQENCISSSTDSMLLTWSMSNGISYFGDGPDSGWWERSPPSYSIDEDPSEDQEVQDAPPDSSIDRPITPPSSSYWIDEDLGQDLEDQDNSPDSSTDRPTSPSAWSMETVFYDPDGQPSPDQSHWSDYQLLIGCDEEAD